MLTRNKAPLISVCLLAIGSLACPGSLENPNEFFDDDAGFIGDDDATIGDASSMDSGGDGGTVTSTAIPLDSVFRPRCGNGCHTGATPQAGLDLTTGDVAERLISRTSSTVTCNGRVYVTPGDPSQSLLYLKLLDNPPCGFKMPSGVTLPQSEIDAIRNWIEAIEPE